MAKRRHATLARFEGAATGVGGIITLVPDMVGLAWIQTRLVFFVAAAYGYDPRDPMRPAELLVLMELYDDVHDGARRARRHGQDDRRVLRRLEAGARGGARDAAREDARPARDPAGRVARWSRSPRSSSTRSPTSAARARSPTGRSASTAADDVRPEPPLAFRTCWCGSSWKGRRSTRSCWCASGRAAATAAPEARRSHRLRAAPRVAPDADGCCEPGARRARDRALRGRRARGPRRAAPPREGEYDLAELLDGPPRTATGMEADLRELLATVQNPHLRALLDARVRARVADLAAVPRRAGGQALPPGLPARAARALARRSPRPCRRSRRPSRGSTATSP